MNLKEHFVNTLKLNSSPAPLSRMILCSWCTTLPLILGHSINQMGIAIFGALMGFALCLNDHFGPLKKRINHLFISYLFLSLSFFVGALIGDDIKMVSLLLFGLAFILGKSKDFGTELERVLLFSSLQLITAAGTPGLLEHFLWIMLYFTIALINYLSCLTLLHLISRNEAEEMIGKRKIFKKIIYNKETNLFAFIFSLTATLGLIIAHHLHISRGYWIVGTALIVMLPSTTLSIYRSTQRLLGTALGVITGCLFINLGHDPVSLIFFCLFAAFLAPLGLIRNYWLGNIFIAALILFLLEISQSSEISISSLALLRIIDIALGCCLGLIGTMLNKSAKVIIAKNS